MSKRECRLSKCHSRQREDPNKKIVQSSTTNGNITFEFYNNYMDNHRNNLLGKRNTGI
jgi:hypothetical protein